MPRLRLAATVTDPWAIDLEDSDLAPYQRGDRVYLILDPEARSLTPYTAIGNNGTPEPVWHRRSLLLAVPAGAVASEVVELLEALEDDLDDLQSCYRGTTWNVGSWDEEWIEISERIELELERCPTYWEASEWFRDVSPRELRADVEEAGSVEAYAQQQAQGAAGNIREGDVAAYVTAELEWGAE